MILNSVNNQNTFKWFSGKLQKVFKSFFLCNLHVFMGSLRGFQIPWIRVIIRTIQMLKFLQCMPIPTCSLDMEHPDAVNTVLESLLFRYNRLLAYVLVRAWPRPDYIYTCMVMQAYNLYVCAYREVAIQLI